MQGLYGLLLLRHDTQSLCQCRLLFLLLLLLSACSHYAHIVIRHVMHDGMALPALLYCNETAAEGHVVALRRDGRAEEVLRGGVDARRCV